MKVLIIGSNGLLARTFIKKYSQDISKLYATASEVSSISNLSIEGDIKHYSLKFEDANSINRFFTKADEFQELDLILFCSSPFDGTLKDSTYKELNIWPNAYKVALNISHLASKTLSSNGKLIYIGSVVGKQGEIAASCVPYSVFKGSLSLLVEGFNKEVSKQAYYINLDGFREKKTEEYLGVDEVVEDLGIVVNGKVSSSHFDIVLEM